MQSDVFIFQETTLSYPGKGIPCSTVKMGICVSVSHEKDNKVPACPTRSKT